MNDKLQNLSIEISKLISFADENLKGKTHITAKLKIRLWGEEPLEIEKDFKTVLQNQQ